jgi:hypothetical protein
MRWSIGKKIGSGFGLALVALTIVGGVSYDSTSKLIDSAERVCVPASPRRPPYHHFSCCFEVNRRASRCWLYLAQRVPDSMSLFMCQVWGPTATLCAILTVHGKTVTGSVSFAQDSLLNVFSHVRRLTDQLRRCMNLHPASNPILIELL